MSKLKILAAVMAFAALGIAAPVALADTSDAADRTHTPSTQTTPGAAAGDGSHTPTKSHERTSDQAEDGHGDMTDQDAATRTSPYKKTYPDEADVGETDDAEQ